MIVLLSCNDSSTNPDNRTLLVSVDSTYKKNDTTIGIIIDYTLDSVVGSVFEIKCDISSNDISDSVSLSEYFFSEGYHLNHGFMYYGKNNNRSLDTTFTLSSETKILYPPFPKIFFIYSDTVTWVLIKNFKFYKIK